MSSFMDVEVPKLSIKDLRALITNAGLSYADCFEKGDLIKRGIEAQAKLVANEAANANVGGAASGTSSSNHKTIKHNLAEYECIVMGHEDCIGNNSVQPDLMVIILHGFGATNNDFVQFGELVMNHDKFQGQRLVFVFPQAPSSMDTMGMPAWWKLEVAGWMQAMQSGGAGLAKLIREAPDGLYTCRERMIELVRQARKEFGSTMPSSKVVFGGFSQGAMTAMDASLSLPKDEAVGATLMISGAPIVVEEWAKRLTDVHKNHRVMVTHGTRDMMLPHVVSTWTKELCEVNGADIDYVSHSGGHELGPKDTVEKMVDFLHKVSQEKVE